MSTLGIHISPDSHPGRAVVGGVLVSLSSSLLMALLGRVSGMSGVLHALVVDRPHGAARGWRASYVLGLMLAGLCGLVFSPSYAFGPEVAARSLGKSAPLRVAPWTAGLAGLLVGFGTKMGGGCTSGHGICGVSRLSPRSVVAMLSFWAAGTVMATAVELWGRGPAALHKGATDHTGAGLQALLPTALACLVCWALFYHNGQDVESSLGGGKRRISTGVHASTDGWPVHLSSLACGFLFAFGLVYSGMSNPDKIIGVLSPWGRQGWDPDLAVVMTTADVLNALVFKAMAGGWMGTKPLLAQYVGSIEPVGTFKSLLPLGWAVPNLRVDRTLVFGSALFGMGWGLAGVCPGPSMLSLPTLDPSILVLFPCEVIGMAAYELMGRAASGAGGLGCC